MIAPGTRLGPYTVHSKLGSGGMGDVYRAHDERLGRDVALKLLPPEFSRDPHRLAMFRSEALALAALNHPGIATIHGFEQPEPGTMFLVLELVPGKSLAERLSEGALPYEDALRIGARIAEALEAAHDRGVVHRDLKPRNIMLAERGVVKVLDFGLARKLPKRWKELRERQKVSGGERDARPPGGAASGGEGSSDDATVLFDAPPETPRAASPGEDGGASSDDATVILDATPPEDATVVPRPSDTGQGPAPSRGEDVSGETQVTEVSSAILDDGSVQSDAVAGTPGYMSPEQIRGSAQDARTDLFAFGCILYQMLCGQRPFPGSTMAEVLGATLRAEPDLAALPARVPARISSLVGRCLAKAPHDRPPDVKGVRLEIEEALGIRRAAALLAGEEAVLPPNNIPSLRHELIGRERELAACTEVLRSARLLTLVGMGGTGKTHLALKVVHDVLPGFAAGAWFVDLASVSQPDRLVPAVAVAMGLAEEPGKTTLQTLLDHLRSAEILIVLDNCEHLIEASAELVDRLLAAGGGVKILATSREVLALPEETAYPVPTLAVPSVEDTDPERVLASPAVRLFAERGKRARPGFEIDANTAAGVAEICRRLDGIPLAIELAAARVKMLGIEQIRGKLDDRFRLLTGGGRGTLPRHQTLRATMQWSYDHLAGLEQELLRKLSVFSGGWTLEAAAAVWGEDADEFEVLDLLTRLTDKSLVIVRTAKDGNQRYRYLETVRQYATEVCVAQGEHEAARDRHLDFYLGLAEASESELVGPEQAVWIERLHPDHQNFQTALSWSRTNDATALKGVRLAGALARFWSIRGFYQIARSALRTALDRHDARDPSPERARALVRLGGMELYCGDYEAARIPIEESLAVFRTLGDVKGVLRALSGLGTVATYGEDFAAARRHNEEVLAAYRDNGDARGVAVTLHNLGFIALCEGRSADAMEAFEEALPILREVGDLKHIALTLADLAIATARAGDPLAAAARLQVSLNIALELGAGREGAYVAAGAVEIALGRGEPERAVRWDAAAAALRESMGSSLAPAESRQREDARARARAELGGEEFDRAAGAGEGLEFETVLEEIGAWLGGMDLAELEER